MLALIRRASFLALLITSMIEMGRAFPRVRSELNSPSVVKPRKKKLTLSGHHQHNFHSLTILEGGGRRGRGGGGLGRFQKWNLFQTLTHATCLDRKIGVAWTKYILLYCITALLHIMSV